MQLKPLLAGAAAGFALGFALVPTSASAASGLLDGSFEGQGAANSLTAGNFCFFSLAFSCGTTTPWSGTGAVAGLYRETAVGSPVLPLTPDGEYNALLSQFGTLQQTFVAQQTGNFRLSWLDAGYPLNVLGFGGTIPYVVELLGSSSTLELYAGTTTNAQPWTAREGTVLASLVGGESYTLRLRSVATTGDTAGIDAVSFSLVGGGSNPGVIPEPATWAMMIAGFGLVGGMMRRRGVGTVSV